MYADEAAELGERMTSSERRCLLCGADADPTVEHIVPQALVPMSSSQALNIIGSDHGELRVR